MSGKYALIIGISEYVDSGLAQLSAPGKDAEDFANVLKDPEIGAFASVNVLVNEPSSAVIEAIDEFYDNKKPDDLLVLYFSGHGVKDELGSLYLAFKNTIRSRLRSTAIKSDYIREAMDQSRSKRQVLILDCCNSGAFPQGTKAVTGGIMGMTQAFQGYGRYVLTATDATQFAWEGDKVIGETENSLFTHFLVKGLKGEADSDGDGRITVDELYDYAYEQISRITPQQTPTKSAAKVEGEIVLRQNMRIEDIKPVALPDDLISEIDDLRPLVREGAVQRLAKMLNGKNIGLRRSAIDALEKIVADENTTRRVAQLATETLEAYRQAEQKAEAERLAALKAEEERLGREKAEAERKAEEERLAREKAGADKKAEAERLAALKAEQERLAREKAESERIAEEERLTREKAEAGRKAREEAERLAAIKVEKDRLEREKAEAERRAEEQRLASAKANAEQKAREDNHRESSKLAVRNEEPRIKPSNVTGQTPYPNSLSILKLAIISILGLCIIGAVALGASAYIASMGKTNLASATQGIAPAVPGEKFRVAVVMPSAINDLAFSQSMYDALMRVQTEMGGPDKFEVVYSENMFVVDDAAAAIRDYATKGYNLVIAHGSQYGSSLQEIAPDFPKTSFAWGTTADTFGQPNIFAYQAASEEGGYVNGVLASTLSKSDVIGVVGPIETGDAKLYVDGFKAGALATKPDAQVNVNYIGSFSDVALASEAATTHISAGADVLTGTAQMVVGAIGKAKEAGALWFGTQSNQTSLAPSIVVASQVYHWEGIVKQMVDSIQKGTLGGTTFTANLKNGGEVIEYNPDYSLSADAKMLGDQTIAGIKDGSINITVP